MRRIWPSVDADLIATERGKLEKAGMTFTNLSPDEAKQVA